MLGNNTNVNRLVRSEVLMLSEFPNNADSALAKAETEFCEFNSNKRIETVSVVSNLINSSMAPIERLTRFARRALKVKGIFLSLTGGRYQNIVCVSGFELSESLRQLPLSQTLCRHVVVGCAPLIIEDTARHSLACELPVLRENSIGSYLGVPLILAPGLAFGALCAFEESQRNWSASDLEILSEIATSLITEIELLSERVYGCSVADHCEGRQNHSVAFGADNSHAAADMSTSAMRQDDGVAVETTGRCRRILIADKDEANYLLFSDILQARGFETDFVSDGLSTLAAIDANEYAMVLLDLSMPAVDGLATARAIRALGSCLGEVPIIALSSNSSRKSIEACRQHGIDALLTAPVSEASLIETVEAFVSH